MAVFDNMTGINVASGFKLQAEAPLDARAVVNTVAERDALVSEKGAYEGMQVYVKSDKIMYILKSAADGTLKWETSGSSNGGGGGNALSNIRDGENPGSIIEGQGGSTNIDNAHIEGYNSGGTVYGVRTLSMDLFVCKVDPESGELIYIEDKVDAVYDISDPNNRAAGTYTYNGQDHFISNVTDSLQVKTALGLAEGEQICLRLGVSDIHMFTVGMTYNFCYPEGSKHRYGKVIGHAPDHIMINGECTAIHRSIAVHPIELPTSDNAFTGNFIFNGGKDEFGDFIITSAVGMSAHSEGINTYASIGGHSEGLNTFALSVAAHAEGDGSTASGFGSHAEGAATEASGHQSHAEGERTLSKGYAAHAEGQQAKAIGSTSHAEGNMTEASGRVSHAEGNNTKATSNYSHAEGHYTEASGMASHAEGGSTKVISSYGHVEGNDNIVGLAVPDGSVSVSVTINPAAGENGVVARFYYINLEDGSDYVDIPIAEGESHCTYEMTSGYKEMDSYMNGVEIYDEIGDILLSDEYSVSFKITPGVVTHGVASHAEGQATKAFGDFSHSEGRSTQALGIACHAEGQGTTADEKQSHAEGYNTRATGERSHAEGNSCEATNSMTHAEGYATFAKGQYSHSEGWSSTASGQVAHVEGYKNLASGRFSHAEGRETVASGSAAHSQGLGTIANGTNQTALGKYNRSNSSYAVIVGNGSAEDVLDSNGRVVTRNRSNAFVMDWSGNGYFAGDVYVKDANTTSNATRLASETFVAEYVTQHSSNGDDSSGGVVWTTIGVQGRVKPDAIQNFGDFQDIVNSAHNIVLLEDIIVPFTNNDAEFRLILSSLNKLDLNGYTLTIQNQTDHSSALVEIDLPSILENGAIDANGADLAIQALGLPATMKSVSFNSSARIRAIDPLLMDHVVGSVYVEVYGSSCRINNCNIISISTEDSANYLIVTNNIVQGDIVSIVDTNRCIIANNICNVGEDPFSEAVRFSYK